MWRPARQRNAVMAVGLLISALGPVGAATAETKLVAACQEPARTSGQGTLTCAVRATGPAEFKDVAARIKGESESLDTRFEAFDPSVHGSTTAYLIQVLPNARRATLAQMADAVVTIADRRDGRRRFTAYTFGEELTQIADSGVSRDEFVRQLVAIKPAAGSTRLYKAALGAVEALAKESGARKSLVILADGTSDDTGTGHDQVVKAAEEAGIAIHVLGYYDDNRQRSKFQTLARLAGDTGGYAAEVKRGAGVKNDFSKEIVTGRFLGEVLENGGTVTATLKGPAGAQTVELTAGFADGRSLAAETRVDVPAAPPPRFEAPERTAAPEPEPDSAGRGFFGWLGDNALWLAALGVILGLGAAGFRTYGHLIGAGADAEADADADAGTEAEAPTAIDAAEPATTGTGRPAEGAGELLRDAEGRPVVYGWLEMLDGNASRHPLRTTNVRVGRHRDNDICLMNDSISRRHAVLHYNADTRRFVITDLGGGNGVIVNKTKYKSRELNDGDMVELGEVRLRFRADTEFLA